MRALFAAILVLVIGGAVAAGAYEAGLAHGAAQIVAPGAAAPAAAVPVVAAPLVAYYGHPYGWGWGFGPFGFLVPILGLFLFFGLMRALVGGRGPGHHGHHGWHDYAEHAVPDRFAEWHKRAHGDSGAGTVPPHQ